MNKVFVVINLKTGIVDGVFKQFKNAKKQCDDKRAASLDDAWYVFESVQLEDVQ